MSVQVHLACESTRRGLLRSLWWLMTPKYVGKEHADDLIWCIKQKI
jgi:hypothetical protein